MKTLRFRSDLVDLNERNRRNSCTILRVSRWKIGQRWPEGEMYTCTTDFFTDPKWLHEKFRMDRDRDYLRSQRCRSSFEFFNVKKGMGSRTHRQF